MDPQKLRPPYKTYIYVTQIFPLSALPSLENHALK